MSYTIRSARAADASQLSTLAAVTFRDTFEALNTPEDMDEHLRTHYGAPQQAAEIADPATIMLLAEEEGGELIGFAQLVVGSTAACVAGEAPVELQRLYVTRAFQGRGVAQSLMDSALAAARARGARTIWLGVWEHNPRAVAFYRKYGFERVGEHTFLLGRDAQTDWIMARAVG